MWSPRGVMNRQSSTQSLNNKIYAKGGSFSRSPRKMDIDILIQNQERYPGPGGYNFNKAFVPKTIKHAKTPGTFTRTDRFDPPGRKSPSSSIGALQSHIYREPQKIVFTTEPKS